MDNKNTPIFKNDLAKEEQAKQDYEFMQEQDKKKKGNSIALISDGLALVGSVLEFIG